MASIRDIAKEAGVSPATVSRVLNQDKKFSVRSTTRQRVMEVVRKLHYDPREHHEMVQSLPPSRSGNNCVVFINQ